MSRNEPTATVVRNTSLLFAVSLAFVWATLWISASPYGPSSWLGSDSYLVVERMRLAQTGIADLYPLTTYYFGQFGLQGIVLGAISASSLLSIPELAVPAALMLSMASAATLALLVPILIPRIGMLGIALIWLSLAASPWVRGFSFSLYWVLPTLVAPLVLMAHLGPRLSRGGRSIFFPLASLFVAFLVKCLCGNEYITTLTLLACAGYALSGWKAPTTFSGYLWIFLTCVAAFAVGIALQLFQLHTFVGGGSGDEILRRALSHTGTDGGVYDIFTDPLVAHLAVNPSNAELVAEIRLGANEWLIFRTAFLLYFGFPALQFAAWRVDIWVFCTIAVAAFIRPTAGVISARSVKALLLPQHAAALAAALALAGALSWQVLAWRHMVVHFHLNGIIFAVGVVPLVTLWVCDTLADVARQRNDATARWLPSPQILTRGAVYLLVGCVFFVGGRAVVANVRVQPETIAAGQTDGTLQGRVERVSVEAGAAQGELTRGLGQTFDWVTVEGWAAGTRGAVLLEIVDSGTVRATIPPSFPHPSLAGTEAAGWLTGFTARIPLLPTADGRRLQFYIRYADGGRYRIEIQAPAIVDASTIDDVAK